MRTKTESGWLVDCAECGWQFESKRSDASFCGVNCRNRWKRRPQKLLNALERLEEMKREVDALAKQYRKNERVYQAVERLQKSVSGSLGWFEVE